MEEHETLGASAYRYNSARQKQIEAIKVKYAVPEARQPLGSVLDQVHRLDRRVESKSGGIAIGVGFLSMLLMGFGMSVVLVWRYTLLGIVIGIVGLDGIIASYPIYLRVLKREREKIAPEIIRLSEAQ